MGMLDDLKSGFHPNIISSYDDIVSNHIDAFWKWKAKQPKYLFNNNSYGLTSFETKKYVVAHKSEMLQLEKEIADKQQHRQEVINSSSKYPHAFYALVKKLSIPDINGIYAILPGTRTCKLKLSNSSFESKYIAFVQRPKSLGFDRPKRSIHNLPEEEYETLFKNIGNLAAEEKRILEELQKEDLRFSFKDEVLNHHIRSKYYKDFLSANVYNDEMEFCISNLNELDRFIEKKLDNEIRIIKRQYPLGTQAFINKKALNTSLKVEIINNIDKISKLEVLQQQYQKIKDKYPLGTPAFERYNPKMGIEDIICHENEIAKFETYSSIATYYQLWDKSQLSFYSNSRNIKDEVLKKWGCYNYLVPFQIIKEDGTQKDSNFKVWQFFREAFGEDETTDSYYYPKYSDNRKWITKLQSNLAKYNNCVYDEIISFIEKLNEVTSSGSRELVVMFTCNDISNKQSVINYHFGYLKSELDKKGIKHGMLVDRPSVFGYHTRIVVIDLVTTNDQLIRNVSTILDLNNNVSKYTINNNKYFTNITYITLLKGFDRQEMLSIIQKKKDEELKLKSDAERIVNKYKKGYEHFVSQGKFTSLINCSSPSDYKKIIAFEEQFKSKQEEIEKVELFNKLRECVKYWHITRYGIPHNYIYEYLKTTAPREANEQEWNIRHLIWAFKNDPDKVDKDYTYNQALQIIVPKYEKILKDTFGSNLLNLTLVCIPASSTNKNQRRWERFAEKVTQDLKMSNGYPYISIINEAIPRHLGGDGIATLHFNDSFFKGKNIIICDDIKTTGASLHRMHLKLESLGATVIGALTIGITIHE